VPKGNLEFEVVEIFQPLIDEISYVNKEMTNKGWRYIGYSEWNYYGYTNSINKAERYGSKADAKSRINTFKRLKTKWKIVEDK
jgi:hypothetical protein